MQRPLQSQDHSPEGCFPVLENLSTFLPDGSTNGTETSFQEICRAFCSSHVALEVGIGSQFLQTKGEEIASYLSLTDRKPLTLRKWRVPLREVLTDRSQKRGGGGLRVPPRHLHRSALTQVRSFITNPPPVEVRAGAEPGRANSLPLCPWPKGNHTKWD